MTAGPPVSPDAGWSVMFTAAATNNWYDADGDEKRQVLDRLLDVLASWLNTPGCRHVASFDDDLLMVGDPRLWAVPSIYILMDVETADVVPAMVDLFRHGDVRLDRYFTLQARLGRPFWPIERVRNRADRPSPKEERSP
ncbi:hypothetical protein [Phytoactinopolyspora limicola]|uniref:hypothetical protein n=1 Tax=Phytoactinopolyspora limicola TaxID=2715536 RepID=UPI00140D1F62|nr:hypothetical protein [Phytoactinopolyspora limicola]